MKYFRCVIFAAMVLMMATPIFIRADYHPEKSSFKVTVKNNTSPYRISSVFLLPSEQISIHCSAESARAAFILKDKDGSFSHTKQNVFTWQAPPEKGIYPLAIIRQDVADTVIINVFVMVPASEQKGEYLNGYRIGHYPKIALRNLDIYQPPPGFIEVTESSRNIKVSPHFTLGTFLCKQEGGYPKYIVLRQRLLLKLELILEKINTAGHPCNALTVMSGYRTPYYNKAIGNVKYSRHVYGGAADIYIDQQPQDQMMDDLNGDQQINWKDAEIVYDIIDSLFGQTIFEKYVGGLGRYKKTANHGPFVHVDVRGFRARWGD